METRTILTALQTALANDTEFIDWCQASIGAKPTIQIEVADIERLDDADFPFIGFFDISQDEGIVSPRLVWEIKLLVGVREPELLCSQLNGCVLKSYSGRLLVEDLREKAAGALFYAGLGCKMTLDGSSVPNQFHPRYYSGVQLTIEKMR